MACHICFSIKYFCLQNLFQGAWKHETWENFELTKISFLLRAFLVGVHVGVGDISNFSQQNLRFNWPVFFFSLLLPSMILNFATTKKYFSSFWGACRDKIGPSPNFWPKDFLKNSQATYHFKANVVSNFNKLL